ncbi:hypothetical protein F5X98DRAFT_357721 [Xylaria grammica]|nr:hypothetical protein F5X98DRAFT_357721 [Xylaria grammica]
MCAQFDGERMLFRPFHTYNSRPKPHALTTTVSAPVETIPAVACSLVTTYYTIQKERVVPTHEFHIILSHGLLLVCYVALGCCVSSYRHRARGQEPYQAISFLIWIAWVGLVGLGAGCEVDTVLVGMIPWAFVAAMLSGYFGYMSGQWLTLKRKIDAAALVDDGLRRG